jgi:DNA-binding PadR family transcriptional regulator
LLLDNIKNIRYILTKIIWKGARPMARKQTQELEVSRLEEDVLAVLMGGHELYGLQIIEAVREATEGRRHIGFGSLYPTLHKLEKKGFVKPRWGEEQPEERGGARRRYYKITGLGERALREAQRVRRRLAAWRPEWGRA